MTAYAEHSAEYGLLPIKVSPFYNSLVQEEVNAIGTGGPLYRNVYPEDSRLAMKAPYEVPDFVGDKGNMGEDAEHVYIQKYPNRLLMLATENCFSNCQYCFRTNLLSEESNIEIPRLDSKIETVTEAVRRDPAVKEVILSGGDPLAISYKGLERLVTSVKNARSDIDFRIHTRAIAFAPQVFKQGLVDLLAEHNIRTYFHITHPYEITDKQLEVFAAMRKAGVRMYNQTPIIRGINDHERVISKLVNQLEKEYVRPVSFFIADPISFGADFRIPLRQLFDMTDQVRWKLPSWAATFRLVLDSPVGKVKREDITNWDEENDTVIFKRQGNTVLYHDLPQSQYIPGDVKKMLWKDDDKVDV